MTTRRRRFTVEFKKKVALAALRGAETVQAIAARHEVHPNQVSAWKRQAVEGVARPSRAERKGRRRTSRGWSSDESRLKEACAKLGELTLERVFGAGWRADPGGWRWWTPRGS